MNNVHDPHAFDPSAVSRAVRALCEGHRLSKVLLIASSEGVEATPTVPAPRGPMTIAIAMARPCPDCRGSGEVEREGKAGVYTVACRCRSSELPGGRR